MRHLSSLSAETARHLRGVLFDLDDTLLDHGRLTSEALAALYHLRAAGLQLIGVTGRPASWGAVLAHMWPVDALITENGAVAFIADGGRVRRADRLSPAERGARRLQLEAKATELQRQFAELVRTDDAGGRVSDITFDIGEYVTVPAAVIDAASAQARALGLRVSVSSVHLHVTLDADDKCSGVLRLLAREFGVDPGGAGASYAYVGDSGNDAPCFAYFRVSVGVSNLRGRFALPPAYITAGARSAGFCELARALVSSRAS